MWRDLLRKAGTTLALLLVIPGSTWADGGKGLLWFGFGEAEGSYNENGYYQIDDQVTGENYQYNEFFYYPRKNLRSLIPSSKGKTTSWFLNYTIFDFTSQDTEDNNHELAFHEISTNKSWGYGYQIHFGDQLSWLTTVEAILGVGFITFEKQISNGDSFDYKWGFDLVYGYAMNSIIWFDEGLYFGWRSSALNNKITLKYGEDQGFLTHRRNIMFLVGGTFSGRAASCVPTAYVQC